MKAAAVRLGLLLMILSILPFAFAVVLLAAVVQGLRGLFRIDPKDL